MRVPSLRAALPPVLIAFVIVTGILANLPCPCGSGGLFHPLNSITLDRIQQLNRTPEPGPNDRGSVALQDGVWTSRSTRG